MAVQVGDLWPFASGAASLGTDGPNQTTGEIRPFATIHMNSGIWHDPSYGQSGVIRYNQYLRKFQVSLNGGLTFQNISSSETLQDAYQQGNSIVTDAQYGGPVRINGDTSHGLFLSQTEHQHPHMVISGVAELVDSSYIDRGSIWLQGHTAGTSVQLAGGTIPVDYVEASARSLGPDTLFINTGTSGITNFRVGSGISQFFNLSASSAINETGLNIPINLQTTPSTWYTVGIASGIRPMVAGFYRIIYTAVVEKTQGNLSQQIDTEIRIYDSFGNQYYLLGSQSSCQVRDSNKLNLNTSNGQWLGDLRAGTSLFLFAKTSEAPPADNSVRAASRKSNIILEWIGPLSGGQSTIAKVT